MNKIDNMGHTNYTRNSNNVESRVSISSLSLLEILGRGMTENLLVMERTYDRGLPRPSFDQPPSCFKESSHIIKRSETCTQEKIQTSERRAAANREAESKGGLGKPDRVAPSSYWKS
jgi:hypothetical protein